ncbi:MAG: maleate cis-trans isomerase [Chloroflexi bacterium]|nr:maleate cis-trans isomerase [Chloroflexota bacterium]
MYGWRVRVGLVMPANNNVMEPELYRVAPEGVSFHGSRMLLGSSLMAPETLHAMARNAERALRELVETNVDVAVYACVSTSVVKGRSWDQDFCEQLQAVAPSVKLQSAATAIVEALRHLGAQRVALATPYPPSVAELVPAYFESWGLTVADQANLATGDVRAVCEHPPIAAYRLARQLDVRQADAVAILATDFRTFEIIQTLEEDLGCPVVSTNQAILWWALRAGGMGGGVPGLGRLLRQI